MKQTRSVLTTTRNRTYLLLMSPGLIVLTIVTVLPFLYLFGASLTPYVITNPASFHLQGIMNYLNLLKDHIFLNSVWVQIRLSGLSVILQILIGLGIALLLHANRKINVLRTIFIIPMVLPPVVVAIIWRVMFTWDIGTVNWVLGSFGLPRPAWLVNPVLALWAIIVANVWEWFPFVMLMILGGLQMLPEDVIEAAKIDGASAIRRFFSVVLPFIRPVILVAAIFRLIDSIKAFPLIFVMTGGGPGIATEPTNYYAYLEGLSYGNIGYSSSMSVAMLLLTFVLTFLVTRIVGLEVERE